MRVFQLHSASGQRRSISTHSTCRGIAIFISGDQGLGVRGWGNPNTKPSAPNPPPLFNLKRPAFIYELQMEARDAVGPDAARAHSRDDRDLILHAGHAH